MPSTYQKAAALDCSPSRAHRQFAGLSEWLDRVVRLHSGRSDWHVAEQVMGKLLLAKRMAEHDPAMLRQTIRDAAMRAMEGE